MEHRAPENLADRVALGITLGLRFVADTFFAKRYGHRAVVLETVAGVPGMVAGMWQHLRSLRGMKHDSRGWIKTLLEEAENERMHLMIFIEIARPTAFERYAILFAQVIFWNFYFLLYVFRTCIENHNKWSNFRQFFIRILIYHFANCIGVLRIYYDSVVVVVFHTGHFMITSINYKWLFQFF